jgi:hypothetical protein
MNLSLETLKQLATSEISWLGCGDDPLKIIGCSSFEEEALLEHQQLSLSGEINTTQWYRRFQAIKSIIGSLKMSWAL